MKNLTRSHIIFSDLFNADVKVTVKRAANLDRNGKPAVVISVHSISDFGAEELFCDIVNLAPSTRYPLGAAAAQIGLDFAEFELQNA